ncbi:MAG: transglutaminase family protein [Akkermansiaceae bacterium]|jgi:hypothetical protein
MGKRTQLQKGAIAHDEANANRTRRSAIIATALGSALVTSLLFTSINDKEVNSSPSATSPKNTDALKLIDGMLSYPSISDQNDIAFLNLAAAPGLNPNEREKIIQNSLQSLDKWAAAVSQQTQKNYQRYLKNPDGFKSEVEWRMAMICTVLGQDFKVRYDPSLTSTSQQFSSNNAFFANPEKVFLTGCLSEQRSGTCASLPVLYVAIGRRMGYPMHLVAAKGHLFARWDDGKGTRVNLEAANSGGFTSHPDSYYRSWPQQISPQEEERGYYLKNLSSHQALAVFLTTRAACLKANGKNGEAIVAANAAFRLAPNLGGIRECLHATLETKTERDYELQALHHQSELARLRMQHDPMVPQPGFIHPTAPFFSPHVQQPNVHHPNSFTPPQTFNPHQSPNNYPRH